MFIDKLKSIESRINNFRTKEEVLEECVERKLYISLERYNNEVDILCSYLLSRSNYKVLKYISKGE